MRKMYWMELSVLLAVVVAGCSKSTEPGPTSSDPAGGQAIAPVAAIAQNGAKLDGPEATVYDFLEAVRTGNDEKAAKMLSTRTREKIASLNLNVTPPASETAKFTVGKAEYLGDDGARVPCTWTDLDEEEKPATDSTVWVLRREPEGWRVAGLAWPVFPGEPPLLLNFEDPQEMLRKKQWAREEIRRRQESGELQAQGAEKQEKPVRR
jgi:hypothetical protein